MGNLTFEQAQEYAHFCIMCDRHGVSLLAAKDWFEQYKTMEK